MKKPKVDFDSPWKDILQQYFEEFMEFFFPEAYKDIDWDKGYEFLDKEFQKIVRNAELGKRLLDKLAKVWRKDGGEAWVLAHIEIQGQEEKEFPRRIYTYNYRIFDRYNRSTASLAILADEHPGWRPDEFGYNLWGCEVSLKFPVVKLLDFSTDWPFLETSKNPFSVVVMAHLKTIATRDDPEDRLNWKVRLVRMLHERGYSREEVVGLFHFIDWLMILPEELETGFSTAVSEYEESIKMPYVSSVERQGFKRGLSEGLSEGLSKGLSKGRVEMSRQALLDIFEARFESSPPALMVECINRIDDISKLRALLKRAVTVSSREEFEQLLDYPL
ncbi:MAG: hypothetical protein V2B18_10330 [Pseudomonadota bacterium]